MDLDELLKSIREEGNSTGGKIVPAKFLGEDRYEKYAEELAQEGTLDGNRLTIEERKKGVKAYRKGKINFKTFVDKVLVAKKAQSVGRSSGPKSIGSGGGALVVRKKNITADDMRSGSSVETEQNLDEILKGIDSIRETLKKEEDLKKKQASDSKKSEERKKRKAKEEKLEGSVFKGLAKQAKKVFAPVKSILDRMIDFFTKILIGRFLVKLIDWMTDGKNQKKLEALGFLLEKTWPALITAFVLFGTSFGGIIRTILGLAIKYTGKLLVAAAKFAIKNPLAAAAVTIVGGTAIGGIMQSQTQSNDPERAAQGKTQLDDTLEFGGATGDPMGALFGSGGGLTPKPKGTDTIPAMLTPGEFVMSKGAVDTFGTGFMEAVNSMGGGTNKPKKSNGTLYASTGGSPKEEPGGRNKTKTKESGGGFGSWFSNLFTKKPDSKKDEEKKDTKSSSSSLTDVQQKALQVLAEYESGAAGYDAVNQIGTKGGRGVEGFSGDIKQMTQHGGRSLTDFTIAEIKALQHDDGKMSNSQWIEAGKLHAVGAYQFIGNTLPGVASRAGIPDSAKFTPAVQDLMALQLMKERGISPWVGPSDKATSTERAIVEQARGVPIAYDKKSGGGAITNFGGGGGSSYVASSGSTPGASPSSSGGGVSSIAASLKTIRSHLGSSSGGQTAQLGKNTPSVSTPTPPVRSQPKVQTVNSGSESGSQADSPPLLSSDTPFIPSPPASAEKMLVMGLPA